MGPHAHPGSADPLAEARDRARGEDENRDQAAVDRRVEAMLVYIEKRRRAWERTLGGMRAAGARGLGAHASRSGQGMAAAERARGEGGAETEANET